MEVWRRGDNGMDVDFLQQSIEGRRMAGEWKEGVIIPIVKKGEGRKVEEYRGVTLMTPYKIYLMVLTERIKKDCEEKRIIPQNETGFRKGIGIIDNIYVINYLVNKQLEKGKKAVALFVDVKAAFDSADRRILYKTMKERGIREGLIERVKELFRNYLEKQRVKIE